MSVPWTLLLLYAVPAASLVLLVRMRAAARRPGPGQSAQADAPTDPLLIAFLSGGPVRLTDTLLYGLRNRGYLRLVADRAHPGPLAADSAGPPPPYLPKPVDTLAPLERFALAQLPASGGIGTGRLHRAVKSSAEVWNMEKRLVTGGLLRPDLYLLRWRRYWRLHLAVCVLAALLAAGVGAYRDDGAAAWLPQATALAVGFAFAPFGQLPMKGRLTPAGRAVLARLEMENRTARASWTDGPHSGPGASELGVAGMAVALFGLAVFQDPGQTTVEQAAEKSSTSSGCGGGDGGGGGDGAGGGDGGSCGGCGGCGCG